MVKQHLDEEEMEKVVGGTVYISRDKMKVGFSSTRRTYNIVNAEYKDVRNLADDLWEANTLLGDIAFDALVESELLARGWIVRV